MKLQDDTIIDAVENIKELYEYPTFKNQELIEPLWNKCAEELETEVVLLRYRWNKLRSYFSHMHKLVKKIEAGIPVKRKKAWPHYERLKFLIPHIEASQEADRIQKDNSQIKDILKKEKPDEEVVIYDGVVNDEPFSAVGATSLESYQNKKRKFRKRAKFDKVEHLLKCIEEKRVKSEENEQIPKCSPKPSPEKQVKYDENEHFLKSLLPAMRKLDETTKMEFRIEIQQLLLRHVKEARTNH